VASGEIVVHSKLSKRIEEKYRQDSSIQATSPVPDDDIADALNSS